MLMIFKKDGTPVFPVGEYTIINWFKNHIELPKENGTTTLSYSVLKLLVDDVSKALKNPAEAKRILKDDKWNATTSKRRMQLLRRILPEFTQLLSDSQNNSIITLYIVGQLL